MPRIDAPTVADHHRQRRAALLAAGADLLASGGVDAVTPAAVGAVAGIARSSVYQYFASSADLLTAIVNDAFPAATARLTEAVASHVEPRAQVAAYVSTALDLATGPAHRAFDALRPGDLPAAVMERVSALHREQYAPLLEALTAAGAPDAPLAAQFIGGMLSAAARAVSSGADPAVVRERLLRAIDAGPLAP